MNFNNINYFIDVAEELSFTKAAKKNYVSQTAISLQISSMEKELGFKLFSREKNEIRLTVAGQSYYEECKKILLNYQQAVRKAGELSKKKTQRIRIGITGPTDSIFLPEIAANFYEKYPDVEISLDRDNFLGIKNKLKYHFIDIAFNFAYDMEGEQGVQVEKLIETNVVLLVSKRHKLAKLDSINPIDVAGEKIYMVSKDYGPANFEHMLESRRKDGYEPYLELVDSVEVLQMHVDMNQGVAFIPEKIFKYNKEYSKTIKIDNSNETNEYVVSKMIDNNNKYVQLFIDEAKKYFEKIKSDL